MAIGTPWVGTSVPGTAAGTAGTSATVDISGATTGEQVYVVAILADSQASAPTAPTGWVIVTQGSEGTSGAASSRVILYRRSGGKQAGDTTFNFTWGTSCKFEFTPISWPGVDPTTPEENATYASSTSGTTVISASVTPTAAGRWAAMAAAKRGTTAAMTFTPDAALTERSDVGTTASAFTSLEVNDSNAAVTQAAHSYTCTASASASHGGSILWYLIPAAAASAPAFVPQTRTMLRVPWPMRRRGQRAEAPPTVAVTVTTQALPPQPRRRIRATTWRPKAKGHVTQPPTGPAFNGSYPVPPQARTSLDPRPNMRPRRRGAQPPFIVTVTVTAQALPPQSSRRLLRPPLRARPRLVQPPTVTVSFPPPQAPRRLRVPLSRRRTRGAQYVPAQVVVVTAQALSPQPPTRRRPWPWHHFGRGAQYIPPQQAITVIVPLTVTGSDRPSSSGTGSSSPSASISGSDRAGSSVTGSSTATATVTGSDKPTSTVMSS